MLPSVPIHERTLKVWTLYETTSVGAKVFVCRLSTHHFSYFGMLHMLRAQKFVAFSYWPLWKLLGGGTECHQLTPDHHCSCILRFVWKPHHKTFKVYFKCIIRKRPRRGLCFTAFFQNMSLFLIFEAYGKEKFLTYSEAHNQLGTPGGAKSFPRGAKIFEICPIFLKYAQHIFLEGANNFLGGGFHPLALPLVTGLPIVIQGPFSLKTDLNSAESCHLLKHYHNFFISSFCGGLHDVIAVGFIFQK